MSVAILVAPLLGGVVYAKAGYYAVYYMAFGLIGLDIILRLLLIEKKIARQWIEDPNTEDEEVASVCPNREAELHAAPGFDKSAGKTQENSEKSNIKAEKPQPARASSVVQEGSATLSDVHTAEPVVNKRSKWPPIITLLKSRRLLTALWGFVVQGSQMTAFDSVVPLFVERTFYWNSIGAGLIFLAVMVPSFLAPGVGWVSDNYGPRWLCVGGFVSAIPFWILLRLVEYDSLEQKVLLCALLALIGVSLTLVMPPLMAEITYIVEAKERESPGCFGATGAYAQAYGLFVTAFAAGTLIGPVWSGYVEDAAGWGTMAWSLGLFSIFGAIPCLVWTGGLITEVNAKSGEERAVGKAALNSTQTAVVGGNESAV